MPDGRLPPSAEAWQAAHLAAGRSPEVLSNLLEGYRGGFPELQRRWKAGEAFVAWLGAGGTPLCLVCATHVADYFGHLQQLGQAGAGRTQAGGGTGWKGS